MIITLILYQQKHELYAPRAAITQSFSFQQKEKGSSYKNYLKCKQL